MVGGFTLGVIQLVALVALALEHADGVDAAAVHAEVVEALALVYVCGQRVGVCPSYCHLKCAADTRVLHTLKCSC